MPRSSRNSGAHRQYSQASSSRSSIDCCRIVCSPSTDSYIFASAGHDERSSGGQELRNSVRSARGHRWWRRGQRKLQSPQLASFSSSICIRLHRNGDRPGPSWVDQLRGHANIISPESDSSFLQAEQGLSEYPREGSGLLSAWESGPDTVIQCLRPCGTIRICALGTLPPE